MLKCHQNCVSRAIIHATNIKTSKPKIRFFCDAIGEWIHLIPLKELKNCEFYKKESR